MTMMKRRMGYVPPQIQYRLAGGGHVDIGVAMRTAHFDGAARASRKMDLRDLRGGRNPGYQATTVCVHDAGHAELPLPGTLVRSSDDAAACDDDLAEAAFQNIVAVQRFYSEVLGRDSIDNSGYPLTATVRYGRSLNNAFWDGQQMLFGDGDGIVYAEFARSLEIVGHELSHAMLQTTSDLDYENQSGALNESFADVMAAMIVQHSRGLDVATADWFIGGSALLTSVGAAGLRSFSLEPAFLDNPYLGTDDQPKHMDRYDVTTEDDGGVHVNAGIPNNAFYRAALTLGGNAWEIAGRVWFEGFARLPRTATFENAAEKTTRVARELAGSDAETAFREAWDAVGVSAAD